MVTRMIRFRNNQCQPYHNICHDQESEEGQAFSSVHGGPVALSIPQGVNLQSLAQFQPLHFWFFVFSWVIHGHAHLAPHNH